MKRVNVLQTVFLTYSFNAKPNDAVVNFGIPDTIIGYALVDRRRSDASDGDRVGQRVEQIEPLQTSAGR